MEYAPNRYRSALHDLPPPAAWRSRQAQMLARAIVTARPGCIVDLAARPERVRLALPTLDIPPGLPGEVVISMVEAWAERAKREADYTVATARVYGEALGPRSEPMVAPQLEAGVADQQEYMVRWMSAIDAIGWVITRAGDTRIVRDASRTYRAAQVLAEAEEDRA